MDTTKTGKVTSKKKAAKAISQKTETTSSSKVAQLEAIKRILYSNGHLKTCSCCGFQWVPMGYKVKGMQELLDNICPNHEAKVLKISNSYIKGCIEDDIPVNRQELEQLISEARGEENFEEDLDLSFDDDVYSFDNSSYSTIDDLESDDFAA